MATKKSTKTEIKKIEEKSSKVGIILDINEWTHDQLGNFVKLTVKGGGRLEIYGQNNKIFLRIP